MILVLIFLAIIIILALCILIIFSLTVQLNIKDLEIGNINKRKKWKIALQIKLFDKFTIYKTCINKKKIDSLTDSKILKKLNIKQDIKKEIKFRKKETLELIRKAKIEIKMLDLKIWVGVEDAILTSFIVAGLGSIIGIVLPFLIEQKNKRNCKYFVNPLYMQKDLYNIKLESIIKVKMVHIINIIYILTMKGRDKNERASNRRSYDYSNGFN